MKLIELTSYLEEIAPLHFQEDYDNSGLIVGSHDMEVKGIIVCLDAIPEVIDEAITKSCNVVVAHHPIIFSGLKKINGKNYIEKAIIKAIKNDIAIYACHTNLDNVFIDGVNQKIAEKIGLIDRKVLSPKGDLVHQGAQIGSGMIGLLPAPLAEAGLLNHLKTNMQLDLIRHTRLLGQKVEKVAICGGSGSFLLGAAISADAQVFITADYKYHQFFDADGRIVIVDIGHYESERYTIELLTDLISKKFSNFAAHYTEVITNPVNYYY